MCCKRVGTKSMTGKTGGNTTRGSEGMALSGCADPSRVRAVGGGLPFPPGSLKALALPSQTEEHLFFTASFFIGWDGVG